MKLEDNPKLYTIRHSLAHILAQAVQQKYPGAKLGFGPPTNEGFFYDFDFPDEAPGEKDLKDIEKAMRKIINSGQTFERIDGDYDQAKKVLGDHGEEPFKQENLDNLKERGVEGFSFYKNGDFLDVCEGPHVENSKELPADAFKLDRIAGAYWLGDEKKPMLTRIYALAFATKAELRGYIDMREKARAYDHKKLGKELDLFVIDDIVGKGLPLWLPNGTIIRDEIQKYAEEVEFKYGYKRVSTPHITKKELYMRSQHLPAYKEAMFPPLVMEEDGNQEEYYLKPMNCPHHHLIFAARPKSYRDLPLRLAEYGTNYRYEKSGELSGLIRVRGMTLNDSHIYIRENQFEEEFRNVIELYQECYSTFGLKDYTYRLSIRGAGNEAKFKGDPAMWDKAEKLLAKVMDDVGLEYFVGEGEAAFYGPKIDIQFKNMLGREETVSTIQVDFLSPENFDLSYTDEEGKDARPVIIHRSPLSTLERFVSYLIEYYGGAFPTWMAPVQLCLLPVHEDALAVCKDIANKLHGDRVRVEVDDSDNSFNKKIRMNLKRKIPILGIVGKNEVADGTITLRRYGVEEQETLKVADFQAKLLQEISGRVMQRSAMTSSL